MLTPRFWL